MMDKLTASDAYQPRLSSALARRYKGMIGGGKAILDDMMHGESIDRRHGL